jgi:mono/diheme cytochrome c family protein
MRTWPLRVPTSRAAFGLLIVLLAVLPFPAPAGKNPPASGDDAASIFKLRCSSCHGVKGAGDTSLGRTLKAADLLSAETQKQTDAQLAEVISDGRKNMPSFSNSLTQDQIRALVAYIRKLGGKAKGKGVGHR